MKKTILLTLALGIASLASADLILNAPATVIEGQAYQIVISGTTADAPLDIFLGEFYEYPANPAGNPTSVTIEAAAGNLAGFYYYPSYGGVELYAGADVQDGDWFTMDMVAGPAGTQLVYDFFDFYTSTETPDVLTVEFVPEPVTLALLALGGLLIRRRK